MASYSQYTKPAKGGAAAKLLPKVHKKKLGNFLEKLSSSYSGAALGLTDQQAAGPNWMLLMQDQYPDAVEKPLWHISQSDPLYLWVMRLLDYYYFF